MNQAGNIGGQISQQGLYWFLGAAVVIIAGVILGFVTGKFLFAREVESIKEQLKVSNTLLESYDTDETKRTRETLDAMNTTLIKIKEDNQSTREVVARLNERQELYERERWVNRSAGGGGNSV